MGKSKVTCPTLLATECLYCYELGHTTKFCPVIAANKKAEERAFRLAAFKQAEDRKKVVKTEEKKPARGFAALIESSDSEEEPKVSTKVSKVVEEFPALSAVAAPSAPAKLSGWATVAAKSQAEYENEKYQQELIAKSIKRQLPPAAKKSWVVRLPEAKKSWADWSDSEDEVEEEEEEEVYKPPLKASEMDWAATEESDDDW
jgi:hypothetical protein